MRRAAAAAVIVGLCAVLAGVAFRSEDDRPAAIEPLEAQEVQKPLLCLHKGTVDRGVSLFDDLVAGGVDPGETEKLISALSDSDLLDMRRLKPGERYEVLTNEGGEVTSFEYVRGVTERITAVKTDGDFSCELVKTPLDKRIKRIEGTVNSSLWESMVGAGTSPEVVLKLADVFAWEIDFLTDPRDGDSYALVVEEFCLDGKVLEHGDILAAVYRGRSRSWTAIGFIGEDGVRRYYAPDGRSVKRTFLKSPLNYRRISSYFTHRRFHPILKRYRPHLGVDYAAATGTPVVSIGDGVVVKVGWNGGFGNYVEVRHNSVYSTCYGHLSKYGRGIRRGVRVKQNQIIGYVGSTGLSTGPHLDFRVKKHGNYVNPLRVESPRAEPVAEAEMARFELEAGWGMWAIDYLPADYVGGADELRTALLAETPSQEASTDLR